MVDMWDDKRLWCLQILPISCPDRCFDRLSSLHLECYHHMPDESWKICHWTQIPIFFGSKKSVLKKPGEGFLATCSMAPFFSRLSMVFSRSSVLFLVRNCLGVLIRGRNESHSNRTHDLRILDGLHSPRRFCQAWANPARRAPTGFFSLLILAFFSRMKGFAPCWLGSLAEELAAWLFWFCQFCWPFWKDYLPSCLIGGPKLWCTDNLEVPVT